MKWNSFIRIAITGPESTGKSTLAAELAKHFGAVWVPEFARGYLDELDRNYNYEDILHIARGQMLAEDNAAQQNNLVFCDTELLVTKIWCEFKYGKCHQWILEELQKRKYDVVLLCNIDLPWQYDPLREHPDKRETLMELYRSQTLLYYGNSIEVSGTGKNRFDEAVSKITLFLENQPTTR